ncbi:hypothetical protein MBLNU13_g09852t2 [Cladosporium sp. NU13]
MALAVLHGSGHLAVRGVINNRLESVSTGLHRSVLIVFQLRLFALEIQRMLVRIGVWRFKGAATTIHIEPRLYSLRYAALNEKLGHIICPHFLFNLTLPKPSVPQLSQSANLILQIHLQDEPKPMIALSEIDDTLDFIDELLYRNRAEDSTEQHVSQTLNVEGSGSDSSFILVNEEGQIGSDYAFAFVALNGDPDFESSYVHLDIPRGYDGIPTVHR